MGLVSMFMKVSALAVLAAVGYEYLFAIKPPARFVEGFFHPHFREVAELFKRQVETGVEPGGAFSIYHQGELLVDLWGGWADRGAEREWRSDTLTMVYSVSKGVAAILAAKMVDRGWLDYDKLVTHYWPEFQIKNITVAMLLSHQAGLVYLDTPLRLRQLVEERAAVEEIITRQQPAWPPGTAFGYHTQTFGLYVDTLLQKAHPLKKNISEIYEEEIGKPFGIEFHFGLPRELHYRATRLEEWWGLQQAWDILSHPGNWPLVRQALDPRSLLRKSFTALPGNKPGMYNDPDTQAVPLSSMLGFTSARDLAKLYGILGNGGRHQGRQLLKPETLARLRRVEMEGQDLVLGVHVKRSPGLFVDFYRQGVVGHQGYGGSVGYFDWERKLGLGYVTNFLGSYPRQDPRLTSLEAAALRLVDSFNKGK